MERSGDATPALTGADDLRSLIQEAGAFLTVSAARPDPGVPATGSLATSIRAAADERFGDEVAARVADAVEQAFPDAAGVVVVADCEGVVFTEPLDVPPVAEFVRAGELPSLAPVIAHRQSQVPFVVVSVDRRGADLSWSTPHGEGTTTVAGDGEHIRKVRGGGWSHRRIQQRAENEWEHLANDVATALAELAAAVQPRVVAVAGDVRMVELLRERMPAEVAAVTREVAGSRSEDGSDAQRDDDIRRWVRTAIAEDTVEVLHVFDRERGQQDRAADGIEETCAALREARVDVLLVHDDPAADTQAYFAADDPTLVAHDPAVLGAVTSSEIRSARATDVAVRTALLTGAGIRVVPTIDRIDDGLAAILRW